MTKSVKLIIIGLILLILNIIGLVILNNRGRSIPMLWFGGVWLMVSDFIIAPFSLVLLFKNRE